MNVDDFQYTPYYCEENIWHLSRNPILEDRRRFVAFISNPEQTCALWSQRSSPEPLQPVIWDYHVVLIVASNGHRFDVFDLDTNAGIPLPVSTYLALTFPHADRVLESFRPHFRIIEDTEYRSTFASDRSHMRTLAGPVVEWIEPPPLWPPIQAAGHTMNLDTFVDMESDFPGQVFSLEEFRRRFDAKALPK